MSGWLENDRRAGERQNGGRLTGYLENVRTAGECQASWRISGQLENVKMAGYLRPVHEIDASSDVLP